MKGTLTKIQKLALKRDGFLDSEIKAFDRAETPSGNLQDFNFSSHAFTATRKSRQKWVKDLSNKGWTKKEITKSIQGYYGLKAGRSPFDFLKLEYSPHTRLSDFKDAVRRQIRARVTRTLGKMYGRQLRPAIRPKFLPKWPWYPKRPK